MTGFRRGRSSIGSVIDLGTSVQQKKNVKRLSVVLFLDLKDVYGNVTHEAILEALEAAELGRHVFR